MYRCKLFKAKSTAQPVCSQVIPPPSCCKEAQEQHKHVCGWMLSPHLILNRCGGFVVIWTSRQKANATAIIQGGTSKEQMLLRFKHQHAPKEHCRHFGASLNSNLLHCWLIWVANQLELPFALQNVLCLTLTHQSLPFPSTSFRLAACWRTRVTHDRQQTVFLTNEFQTPEDSVLFKHAKHWR